jgi:type I restriction enzyme M protein
MQTITTILVTCLVSDLPGGTFTGPGLKQLVLFFLKKGAPIKIWFYQTELSLGKQNS